MGDIELEAAELAEAIRRSVSNYKGAGHVEGGAHFSFCFLRKPEGDGAVHAAKPAADTSA